MNMSYCRFQNTSGDLADCKDALMSLLEERNGKLSDDELCAAKRLVWDCVEILKMVSERADIDVEEVLHTIANEADATLDVANDTADEEADYE